MSNLPQRNIDLRSVGGLKFDEETHTYINNEGVIYKGMSTFCKYFSEPFDGENIARYKAIKNILPSNVFELLKKRVGGWSNVHKSWDVLCKKDKLGVLLHKEKISILNSWGDNTVEGSLEHDRREREVMQNGITYNGKFYPYLPKNITEINSNDCGVVTELMVWEHDLKLCGLVDLVIFDNSTVHVLDYKTNKEITKSGFNGKKLYKPFDRYEDCSLAKYSIQLRGYLEMICRLTGFKKGNCEIIWTSSEKYERTEDIYIPTLELDNELLTAFKNYGNGN